MRDEHDSEGREPAASDEERHHNPSDEAGKPRAEDATAPAEIGGRPGPDPTRYGDWEKNGRCIDF